MATSDTNQSQSQPAQVKTTSSKPPVTLPSSSHLDPGAYVRGSYPINIGQNVLIHPRAYLLSIHCPLIIGDGCIIGEKCVLGGPLPPAPPSDGKTPDVPGNADESESDEDGLSRPTIVEPFVHLHPNATINYGATIKAYSMIESNVVVKSQTMIGQHSKICANLTVVGAIPEWVLVWGTNNHQRRRQRREQFDPSDATKNYEVYERQRLKAMDVQRESTITLLKASAAKALSSGSRSKR